MALYQTDLATGAKVTPICKGSESIVVRAEFPQRVALAVNDIIEMLQLPEDHVVADAWIDSDDLDSNGTPTITLSLGVLNAAKSDIDTVASGGAAWIAASTVGQAGGVARASTFHAMRMQPQSNLRRNIGIKVAAGPATGVAALTNLNVNRGTWQPGVVYTANDFITLPNGVRQKCTTGGTSGLVKPQFHAAYNSTTADGTVTWTTADPVIAVSLELRAAHFGS